MFTIKRADVSRIGWLRRIGVTALLLVTAVVGAACDNDSGEGDNAVASLPDDSAASAPAVSGSGTGDLAAYANCLRSNGLPDFPDPENGALALPEGINPNSREFKDAEAKCARYKPEGKPQNGGDAGGQTWSREDKLKYAKCMRENGATGFSDPDANGDFANRKGDGPDPESAQYKAAEEACKQYKSTIPEDAPQGGAGQ
ncbi:hypothetical protein [Actinoplanes flavus]|uniref:Lipoprotein n=1 Tax=Actinoplanes flavus TaxID=2820290 RepID=A0ABS3US77_9ACTN|nr:hypothetical protein [Actinoplanes flavus]MBO3741428.1 hypothetical protein [Actinoplanes flavus]